MKATGILVALAAVVSGALLVRACDLLRLSEGEQLSFEEARAYFADNRAALERVLSAVDTCRPVRDGGAAHYTRVWASGESSEGLRCSRGNPAGVRGIASALKAVDVLSVDYGIDEDTGQIASASFLLHRVGLAVSGSTTEIAFYAQPQPRRLIIEGSSGEGFRAESRALTAPPFRWFWAHNAT